MPQYTSNIDFRNSFKELQKYRFFDIPYDKKDDILKNVKKYMTWNKDRKKWQLKDTSADVSEIKEYEMHYIEVPYDDKDVAKKLGAKFDGSVKKWYHLGNQDSSQFNRFSSLIVV